MSENNPNDGRSLWVREFIDENGEWRISAEQVENLKRTSRSLYDYIVKDFKFKKPAATPAKVSEDPASEVVQAVVDGGSETNDKEHAEKVLVMATPRGPVSKNLCAAAPLKDLAEGEKEGLDKSMVSDNEAEKPIVVETLGLAPENSLKSAPESVEEAVAKAKEGIEKIYPSPDEVTSTSASERARELEKEDRELEENLIKQSCLHPENWRSSLTDGQREAIIDEALDEVENGGPGFSPLPVSVGCLDDFDRQRAKAIEECLAEAGDFWSRKDFCGHGDKLEDLVGIYAERGERIIRSCNGILDKDVILDMLTNDIMNDNGFRGDFLGATELENIRKIAKDAVARMKETDVLEWRNLMMTGKGFTRVIRMAMEFLAKGLSECLFNIPFDIGCKFPKVWNIFKDFATRK